MVIKELVHSDRVDESLASIVLSAAPSRKRERYDAPENSSSSSNGNRGDDQDGSFFKSRKRHHSSLFSLPATTYSEGREDNDVSIDDDDDEELEDLARIYRTTVFREQRQLPETPYSTLFMKEDEDDDEGLSPSYVGSHPTILRAKTINDNSSADDDIDPHHSHEDQGVEFSELDETSNESYESRGGEESSEREQPEWLIGSAPRPFAWSLPQKGTTQPLFSSIQREISKRK